MGEILIVLFLCVVFYCAGNLIYKYINNSVVNKYDENDYAILEYSNGEQIKLFRNLETDIYEEKCQNPN